MSSITNGTEQRAEPIDGYEDLFPEPNALERVNAIIDASPELKADSTAHLGAKEQS